MSKLENCRVALLTENGVEEIELVSPREALENAGADVFIISPQEDTVRAWNAGNWGVELKVDKNTSEAEVLDYDALLLPGGVMNPDKLRMNKEAVQFVSRFLELEKPVAAICHGPQILIETKKLKGRRMTAYPSIKTDLQNAGAQWEDSEVVQDNNLVTSRKPDDLPAFNKKMIEVFENRKR